MTSEVRSKHVSCSIDFDAHGKQVGDIMVRWSDNSNPLGYHPVPVISLFGREGPTLLLVAGVHGDEFEGPAVIMRLAKSLEADQISGRLVMIPSLNAPALSAISRTSPLDGNNLNRSFPGHPDGGPTSMIADFLETQLIPNCHAVIDLHSGGNASIFAPCTLASQDSDRNLFGENMKLAHAFGLPTIWVLGSYNDDRSVNSAAARHGVPMIAAELHGGGGCEPDVVCLAERGIRNCMQYLGLSDPETFPGLEPVGQVNRVVEISDACQNLYAPGRGVFDRTCSAGQSVVPGQLAGFIHRIEEPEQESIELRFQEGGFLLAHSNRGLVNRGEMLYLIAHEFDLESSGDQI